MNNDRTNKMFEFDKQQSNVRIIINSTIDNIIHIIIQKEYMRYAGLILFSMPRNIVSVKSGKLMHSWAAIFTQTNFVERNI